MGWNVLDLEQCILIYTELFEEFTSSFGYGDSYGGWGHLGVIALRYIKMMYIYTGTEHLGLPSGNIIDHSLSIQGIK